MLIDFVSESTGGPMVYTGRNMNPVHVGMRLDDEDWQRTMHHLAAMLDIFEVPDQASSEVMGCYKKLKSIITAALLRLPKARLIASVNKVRKENSTNTL